MHRENGPVAQTCTGIRTPVTILPDLPKFPGIVPRIVGENTGCGASNYDALLVAISALTEKIDNTNTKSDSIEAKMGSVVSNTDLQQMQQEIYKETQHSISKCVDPLEDKIYQMNVRLEKVQTHGPSNTSQNVSTEAQVLLENQIEVLNYMSTILKMLIIYKITTKKTKLLSNWDSKNTKYSLF